MTQKNALVVVPQRLRKKVLRNKINNGFNAAVAEKSLSGNDR